MKTVSHSRHAALVRLVLIVTVASPAAGAAAAWGQATVVGRVVRDSTKEPIVGAEIVWEGAAAKRAQSDSAGRFVLADVPSGLGFALVRKIGFRPVRLKTLIFGEDTLNVDVKLSPAAVELPPVEVVATAVPPGMQPFADRRLAGFGAFIGPNTLRNSEGRRLADLLFGMHGVRVVQSGAFKMIAASSRAGRACPMAVWVDGIRIYTPGQGISPPDLNDFPITQLDGIEVYRGEAETPSELGGSGAGCGTIVLWTRRS